MEERKVYFHKDILADFRKKASGDEFPHAIILYGNEGCGHLELALNLSEIIVQMDESDSDIQKQESGIQKLRKLIHPDIHFSFPFYGNSDSNEFLPQWREMLTSNPFMSITHWMNFLGADNKQANINAKECGSIIKKLSLKSFEGDYKVLIMWLPEFLGKEGNRLLKLIEEPPEKTVFIFVTEQLEKILSTIISRCQMIHVPNPGDEEIRDRLIDEKGWSAEKASKIAYLADGNFGKVYTFEHESETDFSAYLFSWLRLSYKLRPEEIVKWCDDFSKLSKAEIKYFILYVLRFMRSFIHVEMGNEHLLRLNEEELKLAKNLKSFIDVDFLAEMERIMDDSFTLVERNANIKMLFLNNSIRVNELFHGIPQGIHN